MERMSFNFGVENYLGPASGLGPRGDLFSGKMVQREGGGWDGGIWNLEQI